MSNSKSTKQSLLSSSVPELVTFYVSLAIVGLIIGLIVYCWVRGENRPPILSVSLEPQQQIEGQYYLPFTVKNGGDQTAEAVEIIAELTGKNDLKETGNQQIDFLSGGETTSGAFVFSSDPQQGVLVTRVASYKNP